MCFFWLGSDWRLIRVRRGSSRFCRVVGGSGGIGDWVEGSSCGKGVEGGVRGWRIA